MCYWRHIRNIYLRCGHALNLPDELIACDSSRCKFSPNHPYTCVPPTCKQTCCQYRQFPHQYSPNIDRCCPMCESRNRLSGSDEINEERIDPHQDFFQVAPRPPSPHFQKEIRDARTLSQSPSSPDIDTTSPHGRSGFDEFNEERDDPYQKFFQPNLSSSSDPSPRRRFWKVLRLPVNKSMISQGRLNRHLFTRRSRKDPAGGQDTDEGEDAPGGKDTTEGNNTWSVSEAPAKFARGPSSEVVEVCAARGFRRYVVWKRQRKTEASSSDCSDSSSDCSDSSIQGSWNQFLAKICYPCGRYYEDD